MPAVAPIVLVPIDDLQAQRRLLHEPLLNLVRTLEHGGPRLTVMEVPWHFA